MGAPTALLRMAVRNVRRHWRHSTGSILSIAVGFLAIGLFEGYLDDLAITQAATLSKQGMYGDLVIERTGASTSEGHEDPWAFHLGEAEQAFLDDFLAEHRGEVLTRARFLTMTGLASTGKAGAVFLGTGYDVAEGATLRGELAWLTAAGKPLELAGPGTVLLAQGLGSILDCAATSSSPAPRGPQSSCGPSSQLPRFAGLQGCGGPTGFVVKGAVDVDPRRAGSPGGAQRQRAGRRM